MNFIHVIYDREYHNILAKFENEEECIKVYKRYYNKEKCDFLSINLACITGDWETEKQRIYEEYPH